MATSCTVGGVCGVCADEGQVAIFDATNSTRERRTQLRAVLHGKVSYLFIESICNDSSVLENNLRNKMLYSPDYAGVDMEKVRGAPRPAPPRPRARTHACMQASMR